MTQSFVAPHVAVGQVIADKYVVERVIGEGGMGVVVAARRVELDERFAIKFLLPEALANAEAVARFAREARASVKIKSEHVARTLDVGRLESGAPSGTQDSLRVHRVTRCVLHRHPSTSRRCLLWSHWPFLLLATRTRPVQAPSQTSSVRIEPRVASSAMGLSFAGIL